MSKSLLSIKGFVPYIIALFLNAFTDLGHKIIIQNTVFKLYDERLQIILTALLSALVLLPFIMLFTPSGYISDKFAKNAIMRYAAFFAVVITLCITASYYLGWLEAAFFLTFILSMQSAIYSPAKYGYIKELVGQSRISSANAVVQAATTVAILGGILFYTVLFEWRLGSEFATTADILQQIAPLGWLLVIGSIIEFYLAMQLPNTQGAVSKKSFEFKRYKNGYYLRKNFKTLSRKREIFIAVIALSLFWSISQVILAIFGAYAKTELAINNAVVVQGMMALAGIGIILGSYGAARLSRYYIHLGLVPLGVFGFSLIALMLPFLNNVNVIAGAFLIFGIFSGLFIIPLNSYIQQLSPSAHLGVILAGNNFVQNIFMFSSLILTTLFAYYGFSAFSLFILMGSLGIMMFLFLVRHYAVMFLWLLFELLLSLRYKISYEGVENISDESAVLLLGNHISWIDWLLIQLPVRRRITYVIDREIYGKRFLKPVFELAQTIPISSRGAKEAFSKASQRIASRQIVGLFPEGRISYDGEIGTFYRGFEQIAKSYNGAIVPFYIAGMYDSIFSRSKGRQKGKSSFLRRHITIVYGNKMPLQSSAESVHERVKALEAEHRV